MRRSVLGLSVLFLAAAVQAGPIAQVEVAPAQAPAGTGVAGAGLSVPAALPGLGLSPAPLAPTSSVLPNLSLPAPKPQAAAQPAQAAAQPAQAQAAAAADVSIFSRRQAVRKELSGIETQVQGAVRTLAEDSSSPSDAHAAGGRIEAALTGESVRAPASADLPPAGSRTDLDAAQSRWLAAGLGVGSRRPGGTSAPRHSIESVEGFNAIVRGRRKELRAVAAVVAADPKKVTGVLSEMYQTLSDVVNSDLPAADRWRLAYALNRRFADFLGEVLRQEELSAKTRVRIERAKREFLDDPVLLEEFAWKRRMLPRLRALALEIEETPSGRAPATEVVATPAKDAGVPADDSWQIGPPIPKWKRGGKGVSERTYTSGGIARFFSERRFAFEKLRTRWQILEKGEFSPRFRDKIRAALEGFRRSYSPNNVADGFVRFIGADLPKSFTDPDRFDPRRHALAWVPGNKNLRLRMQGNAALVTADFETDIADARALETIKTAIEEYWQGEFVLSGKTMSFRTLVNIRRLAPGQAFSPGSLTLRESPEDMPFPFVPDGGGGIFLSRKDLAYGVAAHEFGHILGLNDEYMYGYRASDRTRSDWTNNESLMGDVDSGNILARHLKTAYLLLRRRSLEK